MVSYEFSVAQGLIKLDPTFGTNGISEIGFSGKVFYCTDAFRQIDGKIVCGGDIQEDWPYEFDDDFCFFRLNQNGTIDPSFQSVVYFNEHPGKIETLFKIDTQTNGHILAVGRVDSDKLGICRLNPTNGQLENGFGPYYGRQIFPAYTDRADFILTQDEKIILMGRNSPNANTILYKLNANGSLDSDFGDAGKSILKPMFPYKGLMGNSLVV